MDGSKPKRETTTLPDMGGVHEKTNYSSLTGRVAACSPSDARMGKQPRVHTRACEAPTIIEPRNDDTSAYFILLRLEKRDLILKTEVSKHRHGRL